MTNLPMVAPVDAIAFVQSLMKTVDILRRETLKDGVDFGVIPGTGDKPALLLPGMEKLTRALNVAPEYPERRVIVDYDKMLFHYEYECILRNVETGQIIPGGRGLGLCTSMESSFRWRKAERICPTCGKAAIIKGKDEYGGGYVCFKKKDGCGAKFTDSDPLITSQVVGRVENVDIADQINAIMKRAKKRALGDAIKGAACVSEYFSVDLEDNAGYYDVEATPVETSKPVDPPAKPKAEANGSEAKPAETKAIHWTEDDSKVTQLVKTYEKKYSLANLVDMERIVGKMAKSFETGKAFGTALDKAMVDAAKNEPPAKPKDWWNDPDKLAKLKIFLSPFQMPFDLTLLALKLDNWTGFTSVDQAMQAVRALAINEAWPILVDKARYLKTALGNTNIIFDTPLGGLLLYSREKFANTMVEQSIDLKDEWEKVKTWEILPDMGYHDLPEQIRLVTKFVEEKDGKAAHLEISEIECVAQVAF